MSNKKSHPPTPNLKLRAARLRRLWSQADVAGKLGGGATLQTVSGWENGDHQPGPHYRRKLCEIFECEPEDLGLAPASTGERDEAASVAAGAGHPVLLLPPQPPDTILVGRDALLDQLRQRLVFGGAVALSALNGLPGVGKTALALALAHDPALRVALPDGVLWAGLGRDANVMGILSTWGAALGLKASEMEHLASVSALGKAIQRAIGERRMLLVVDDAWTAEAALAFRVGGPHCAQILTTRFPVIARYFAPEATTTVEELAVEDGVDLLARLVPDIAASEPVEARALVRAVGGLPLALTILGRVLYAETHDHQPRRVHAALARLLRAENRLRLAPPSGLLDPPPGMPAEAPFSLQAAIAVSADALTLSARQALRALAAFPAKPNSFSDEAALAAIQAPVTLLDELSDVGLLESAGPGRYALHQTIADFARIEAPDPAAPERLMAYFVAFLEQHTQDYDTLEREASNLLAALETARILGAEEALVRGVVAFAPYLEARGLYDDAEVLVRRAEHAALAAQDTAGLAATWLHKGRLMELRGRFLEAAGIYEDALPLARRTQNLRLEGALLARAGEAAVNLGEYPEAEDFLTEAMALAHESGDDALCAILRNLGEVQDCRGNFAAGDEYYRQALALARETGDAVNQCVCLQNLGAKAAKLGDFAAAETYLLEGIETARRIRHRQRLSAVLTNIGLVALWQGRLAEAEAYLDEAVALARVLRHPTRLGSALQNQGILATKRGDFPAAEAALREALDHARQAQQVWLTSETLSMWGEACLMGGQPDAARLAFSEALRIAREVGGDELQALALFGLAQLTANRGNLAEARRLGSEAMTRFTNEGHFMAHDVERWLGTLAAE